MDHITIKQIRSDLEQKRGEPYSDEQFKMLLSGFSSRAQRQGLYTSRAIRKARERGWMSVQMVHFFKQYATE